MSFDTSSEKEFVGFFTKGRERTETRIWDRSFLTLKIATSPAPTETKTETEVVGTEVADVPQQE